MAKKTSAKTPTDEEIRSYDSVPIEVAASYIGWSSCNISWALQQERAPFGVAVQTGVNEETGRPSYSYNISPGLLVAYKRGELEAWRLGGLVKMLSHEINSILDSRLEEILTLFSASAAVQRRKVG